MRIKFIGAKYHPLVHQTRIDLNHEAVVDNDFGMNLISRYPADWEEVKPTVKQKPARAVKKKSIKKK